MKIGIDASRANILNKTGTEWFSYHIIQELKKLAKDSKCQYVLYSELPFEKDLIENAPDNFIFKRLKWPPKFLWSQIRLSVEMLFNKPDILYIPAHVVPIIHPKKVILTLHDIGFERQPGLYDPKPIGPKNKIIQFFLSLIVYIITFGKYRNNDLDYNKWSTRFGLKVADRVLTISEFSKKDIAEFYNYNINKISVTPNGFDHLKFGKQINTAKINISKEKFDITGDYLYFIGRLEAKKNICNLIYAYNILKNKYNKNIKLVLAGSPGYKYEAAKKLIEKFNLKNYIIETGYIQEDDMINLLAGASVFVFPSNYEGFGVPILEAQAMKIPVACSNTASLPEASGGAAYFFDQNNPEDIAQTINELLENDKKSDLIEMGLKNIKRYSWERTGLILYNILNK